MIFRLMAIREGGQGTVEMVPTVRGGSLDLGLAILVPRDDPPLGLECPPGGLAPLPAERVDELVFLDINRQGPEPLAGGQVQEVAQQVVLAKRRVALVLPQALDQPGQPVERLIPGEVRRLALAGGDVREQLHVLADCRELGERPQEEALGPGPGSSPRTDSPRPGRPSGSPERRTHRIGQQLTHTPVLGSDRGEGGPSALPSILPSSVLMFPAVMRENEG